MQQTLKSTLMIAAALAMLLTVLPLNVTAQSVPPPTVAIENLKPPLGAIKPETTAGQMTFTLRYTTNQATPPVGAVAPSAVIHLTPSCENPNVKLLGPNTVLITVTPGATSSFPKDVTYQVSATRQAPGLQLITCTMKAQADALQGTAVPATTENAQTFTVTVDYFPYISAKVSSATLDAGPQKPIPFAVVVTNFGNAQTQVTFQLATEPTEEWKNVILPPPLTLDSPNSGGAKTEDTATLTVNTPYKNGWNNKEQAYTLTMTPVAALDNSKAGVPISVSMFARSRGIYVPGPEPMLLVAGILGAALLARLSKRGE